MRPGAAIAIACTGLLCACGPRAPEAVVRDGQPPMYRLAADDEALREAMATARDKLPEFIDQLENPRPNQSAFCIEARFADGRHVERVWISAVTYRDGRFRGTVANAPVDLRNIARGDAVQVAEAEVVDWLIVQDGEAIGAWTLQALRPRLNPEQQAELDRCLRALGGAAPRPEQ